MRSRLLERVHPKCVQVSRSMHALTLLALLLLSVSASAAISIQVNTTGDEYGNDLFGCSLREALHAMAIQANFGGCGLGNAVGVNTIVVPAGVYSLSLPRVQGNLPAGGPLYVSSATVIAGAGAGKTIIDGGGIDDVLDVEHSSGTVTLSDLTVRNGAAIPGNPTSFNGVGIRVVTTAGTFNTNNIVVTGSGFAGSTSVSAVYIQQAVFNLVNTSIVANPATALVLFDTQAGKLQNVTISNNVTGGSVAGIEAQQLAAPLLILNSTIAYNNATYNDASVARSGGIHSQQVTVQIANSILARNMIGDRGAGADCNGLFTSLGYNLVEDAQQCTILGNQSGNITGIDPKLAPVFDYGGGIPTHLLLPKSAALGAGNPALPGSGGSACPATDARGSDRVAVAPCDIGAYEYRADFTVDSTLDAADSAPGNGSCASTLAGAPCTLRAAIQEAVSGSKFRTIRVPAGHYQLTAGANPLDFSASHAVTLIGDGADGTWVEQTQNAVVATVAQTGASLHAVRMSGAAGGIIAQSAGLLLDATRISGSTSLPGILLLECCATDLLLAGSTVDHNKASVVFGGGGMYVGSGSSATIVNSTFHANSTLNDGGGIYNHGGSVSMAFTTIAGNSATAGSAGDVGGGGIARGGSGSFFIGSSIIAGNHDASGQGPDCAGTVQLGGWTLLRDSTGCVVGGQAGKLITGVDPQLSSLALQGGHTPTLGLGSASPAHGVLVQAGECVDADGVGVLADQRGTARPTTGYGNGNAAICDLGAFQGISDVIFADGFE